MMKIVLDNTRNKTLTIISLLLSKIAQENFKISPSSGEIFAKKKLEISIQPQIPKCKLKQYNIYF